MFINYRLKMVIHFQCFWNNNELENEQNRQKSQTIYNNNYNNNCNIYLRITVAVRIMLQHNLRHRTPSYVESRDSTQNIQWYEQSDIKTEC